MTMDAEEKQAMLMEERQLFRWEEDGKRFDFWGRPDEVEMTHEIARLKKMSRSYQERHGWPKDGIG